MANRVGYEKMGAEEMFPHKNTIFYWETFVVGLSY